MRGEQQRSRSRRIQHRAAYGSYEKGGTRGRSDGRELCGSPGVHGSAGVEVGGGGGSHRIAAQPGQRERVSSFGRGVEEHSDRLCAEAGEGARRAYCGEQGGAEEKREHGGEHGRREQRETASRRRREVSGIGSYQAHECRHREGGKHAFHIKIYAASTAFMREKKAKGRATPVPLRISGDQFLSFRSELRSAAIAARMTLQAVRCSSPTVMPSFLPSEASRVPSGLRLPRRLSPGMSMSTCARTR